MKRKITITLGILVAIILIWYLFIKPEDYIIRLKANTAPGTAYHMAKEWKPINSRDVEMNLKHHTPFSSLEQEVTQKGETFILKWSFTPVDNDMSLIRVGIKQVNGNILDRLLIPFKEIAAEEFGKIYLLKYKKELENHLKRFKVTVDGKSIFPGGDYAYITLKSSLKEKANDMIRYNIDMTSFLKKNGYPISARPLIEVTDWDKKNETLTYNFCFPVVKKDTFPNHPGIKFKHIEAKKAIKATFNGNYRISDRAWFALEAYAKKEKLSIEKPLEIFYDNPNFGGNELDWRADIFIPYKNAEN